MFELLFKKMSKAEEFENRERVYSIYDRVSKEIEVGEKDNGVWAKAFSDSKGDATATELLYIKLMVERYVKEASETSKENALKINMNLEKQRIISDQAFVVISVVVPVVFVMMMVSLFSQM